MITEIHFTFQKVIKNNINHIFDGELRHVAIMDYIEASLITSDATFLPCDAEYLVTERGICG